MAELAPMPTASVRIATAVKAGFFFSIRSAYFKSCRNVCIALGPPEGLYVLILGLVQPNESVLLVNTAEVGVVARKLLSCGLRSRSQNVILNRDTPVNLLTSRTPNTSLGTEDNFRSFPFL